MKILKKFTAILLSLVLLSLLFAPFASAANKLDYLVLGDSIGYGAGVYNSSEACYGRIVADTEGYNFENRAVNGYTTSDLISYLGRDGVKNSVKRAEIISVSIGGNDFLSENLPILITKGFLGNYDSFKKIEKSFYANFCQIMETLQTLNPKAVVLVQTLYNPMYVPALRKIYAEGTKRVNEGYRRCVKEISKNAVIVDVAAEFEGHPEYVAWDTIHPNALGNVAIARTILKTLKNLKLGGSLEPVILHKGRSAGISGAIGYAYDTIVKFVKSYKPKLLFPLT